MEDILRDIGMIARALDSISNVEFKEFELTKGQYLYLVRVCENPGIIQEELVNLIKVDRTTASRAIQKLETTGFFVRKGDEINKKIKRIYPTKKAQKIYPTIKKENIYSNEVALSGFSEAENHQLHEMLQRVQDNVSNDWEYVKKGNKRNY